MNEAAQHIELESFISFETVKWKVHSIHFTWSEIWAGLLLTPHRLDLGNLKQASEGKSKPNQFLQVDWRIQKVAIHSLLVDFRPLSHGSW